MVSQGYAAQGAVRQEPSASVRLALAVVASVCGALITGALAPPKVRELIQQAMEKYRIGPQLIALELTEGSLFEKRTGERSANVSLTYAHRWF